MKDISYVVVSRNDSYCGDSVGRLVNTLNHTGEILFDSGVLEKSEVILVDWDSPDSSKPLKSALKLKPHIKKILKIVTIPKDVAAKHQKDSPFSEVHAMNVGFRKMSGRYFARIDNDTLIGRRFINWFHNDFDFANDPKVAFSGRRNLNEIESRPNIFKSLIYNDSFSKQVEICHPNNHYSRLMSDGRIFAFYGGAVGVMIVERELYLSYKGFNEDLVYMNNMDTEFINRMASDNHDVVNLSLATDSDFYHQHHERTDGASGDTTQPHAKEEGMRKTNEDSSRFSIMENKNLEDWGLNSEVLDVFTFPEFLGEPEPSACEKGTPLPPPEGGELSPPPDALEQSERKPSPLLAKGKNKNVIYIIHNVPGEKDFKNPGYQDTAWMKHTTRSLLKYADQIDADLKILSSDNFPIYQEAIEKHDFTFYQKSTFLKPLLLHYFAKSDYEKFLLLDLDMIANKGAENIFDFYQDKDFVIGYGFNEGVVRKNEVFLKQYLKAIPEDADVYFKNEQSGRDMPKYNLNLGVYIISKMIAEKMTSVLPDEKDFVDFLGDHNLLSNPVIDINGEPKDFIDQDLYAYAYAKTDVLDYRHPIDWMWNANWEACFLKDKEFQLCHLTGADGKQFLLDNLDNPEVISRTNVEV